MQPRYDVVRSEEFVADVTAIYGDIQTFEEAFAGYAWYLCRLPRGPGTWDLSAMGELRLGSIPALTLDNGVRTPAIYFTFELRLGPAPSLVLLRAYQRNDPVFS
jgi:hypothetical protein